MQRIAVTNEKGGVGKTSTTVHVAAALAQAGQRTLVVDLDAQGDTSALYVARHEQLPRTVADIFAGTAVSAEEIAQPTGYHNLSIITADDRLRAFDMAYGYEDDPRAYLLADALTELQGRFDVALFDCPPRPHMTTFAGLLAATMVAVPVEPSRLSLRSLMRLHHQLAAVRETKNPQLAAYYFLSKFEPSSPTDRTCRDLLLTHLDAASVLSTAIPRLRTFNTAINAGLPVTVHSPRSKAAAIIRQFANELVTIHNEHDAIPHAA